MRNVGEVAFGTAALFGVTAALIIVAWRERKPVPVGLGGARQRVVLNEVGAVALAREPESEFRERAEPRADIYEPVGLDAEPEALVVAEAEPEAVEAPDIEAGLQFAVAEFEVEADVHFEKPAAPPAAVRPLADLSQVFADLMPTVEAVVDVRDRAPEDQAEAEDYVDIRDEVVEVTDRSAPVIDLDDDMFPADVAHPRRLFR